MTSSWGVWPNRTALVATMSTLNGARQRLIVGSPFRWSSDWSCRSPSGPLIDFSETEAKANRGIDRVAMKEAVRQAAIDLREHQSGVGIKLLRKLPIDDERN